MLGVEILRIILYLAVYRGGTIGNEFPLREILTSRPTHTAILGTGIRVETLPHISMLYIYIETYTQIYIYI